MQPAHNTSTLSALKPYHPTHWNKQAPKSHWQKGTDANTPASSLCTLQAHVKVTGFTEAVSKTVSFPLIDPASPKLKLPSFDKFTIGLNRQVDVYFKTDKTLIFSFQQNASHLAVYYSDRGSQGAFQSLCSISFIITFKPGWL